VLKDPFSCLDPSQSCNSLCVELAVLSPDDQAIVLRQVFFELASLKDPSWSLTHTAQILVQLANAI
jgi:hypothetical protein